MIAVRKRRTIRDAGRMNAKAKGSCRNGEQTMADNGRLSPRQERAVLALLLEPNIREATKSAGVGERTVYAWLKDPVFGAAYREARKAAVTRALGSLQQAASEAVETLTTIMQDETAPAPARVSAAKNVLDFDVKAVELEE